MPDAPVIVAAEKFRRALLARDAQALGRLARAYGQMYRRLQNKIDLLIGELGPGETTRGRLVRMTRYKELQAQIAAELRDFQGLVRAEVGSAADLGISAGITDARQLLSYTVSGGPGVAARFNVLPKSAVETLLGFLSPDGPLFARLSQLAPQTAQRVADGLVQGVGLGYNPRKIARLIRSDLGQGLTDALRMTRTAQLYSYREANRATYIANGDVCSGWYWHAFLGDNRTCASCIAQHGSFHTLDETLNDHHSGRCSPIPAVRGFPSPIEQNGEDWFKSLPEARQRELLGSGKFDAWQGGKFDFGALSTTYQDDIYGTMRREAALKELVE